MWDYKFDNTLNSRIFFNKFNYQLIIYFIKKLLFIKILKYQSSNNKIMYMHYLNNDTIHLKMRGNNLHINGLFNFYIIEPLFQFGAKLFLPLNANFFLIIPCLLYSHTELFFSLTGLPFHPLFLTLSTLISYIKGQLILI